MGMFQLSSIRHNQKESPRTMNNAYCSSDSSILTL
jgi:hypothetical protein